MKPKFFFICLLLSSLGFSSFAQESPKMDGSAKTVQFNETYHSLSIQDNITVILTEGKSDKIFIEGNAKAVDARVSDGHLTLSAGSRFTEDVKVYVPADFVSKVYMNAAGSLNSAATLSNSKIKIYLAAEARINVRSTGNVAVETIDDIQFVKGR